MSTFEEQGKAKREYGVEASAAALTFVCKQRFEVENVPDPVLQSEARGFIFWVGS